MIKMKNLVCLLLALAMCLALTGCGGSGTVSAPADTKAPEATQAPTLVYASTFRDLAREAENYISVRSYSADGLYYSSWEKIGESIPEGVKPRFEGQYDVYSTFLYHMSPDGQVTKLEKYAAVAPPENEQGYREFNAGSEMSGICFTPDGFVTIEMTYASWLDGDGEYVLYSDEYFQHQKFVQHYFIRSFDAEGNERSCAPIEVAQDEWLDAYRMQLDDKGNVIVSTGSGLRALNLEGQDAYEITAPGYVSSMVRLADGRIAVFYTDGATQAVGTLDSESGKIVGSTPVSFDTYSAITGDENYDLYYTNGAYFYGYRLGDAAPTKLFSWIDCDVNSGNLTLLDVTGGVVTGMITRYNSQTERFNTELVTVQQVPSDTLPQKQPITLAVLYLDYNVQDLIIDYNRHNDQYRIVVLDYSEYGTDKDGNSIGLTKLNTEILSGNVPDMLCLNGLNYRHLANKGILADLYPFIDADPALKRSDFFPNVLAALEVNGQLCSTVSGFYISSAIGSAAVVGDEPGWTYEEFNAALASMPEGCTAFDQYVTRDNILSTCLALDMADYVDWGTGRVSFDSPEFIKLLEFAYSFPSEFDWENYDYSREDSTEERLAQGKQMLVQTSAYSINDIFYNNYTQFLGGRITYIGYPTAHGTGNMISFSGDSGYAISSKSPYQEAAWQFLRIFFTRDYQSENVYSLPSRLDVFDDKAAEATTIQYVKNEDGHYVLDDDGEKIPVVRASMWNAELGKVEEIYCLTEEQVEQIRALILTTTKVADYNQEILDIVKEQAAPFFAGQKSAEEVAKLVQSKANIYVNEQR